MSPIAHFIGSWLVATVVVDNPRDRRLVTLAGILPDADGVGMVADVVKHLATGQELNFLYYQKFHHLWCHGWPAAIALTLALTCFANQRWRVAPGCLITFHLHLICDLLGSRGPSVADLWPICYSEPLFRHPVWFWKGQWRLDGWQNTVICLGLFASALAVTVKRGYSFADFFGQRTDAAFASTLQKWWKSIPSRKSS
jgi:hypothetical protein